MSRVFQFISFFRVDDERLGLFRRELVIGFGEKAIGLGLFASEEADMRHGKPLGRRAFSEGRGA